VLGFLLLKIWWFSLNNTVHCINQPLILFCNYGSAHDTLNSTIHWTHTTYSCSLHFITLHMTHPTIQLTEHISGNYSHEYSVLFMTQWPFEIEIMCPLYSAYSRFKWQLITLYVLEWWLQWTFGFLSIPLCVNYSQLSAQLFKQYHQLNINQLCYWTYISHIFFSLTALLLDILNNSINWTHKSFFLLIHATIHLFKKPTGKHMHVCGRERERVCVCACACMCVGGGNGLSS
jgi:hypothetical protein